MSNNEQTMRPAWVVRRTKSGAMVDSKGNSETFLVGQQVVYADTEASARLIGEQLLGSRNIEVAQIESGMPNDKEIERRRAAALASELEEGDDPSKGGIPSYMRSPGNVYGGGGGSPV